MGNNGDNSGYSSKAGRPVSLFLRFFSSIKLAMVLILLVGSFSLSGAFVPGIDVFHSWWFLVAGFLLMVNIVVCTLHRWKSVNLQVRGAKIIRDESYYRAGKNCREVSFEVPEAVAAGRIKKILRILGYRVREESENGNVYLAADRNRYFRLGTLVSHFSIVLFVLAYLLGSYFGFKEAGLAVAEGNMVDIGHDTGLTLELESFKDTYYTDGTPQDYRSRVVLYENGKPVGTYLIRVNEPLSYKDIRIYQSFFGPAIHLKVTDSSSVLFDRNVPLDRIVSSQGQARPAGSFALQQYSAPLALVGNARDVEDKIVPPGQVGLLIGGEQGRSDLRLLQKGVPLTIGDAEFTYQGDSKFSGFQVNRDPANSLIWIASILFITGNAMIFYFPYRRLWAIVGLNGGYSRILIKVDESRGLSGTGDMTKIISKLSTANKPENTSTGA